jgi:hypothetical protein
MFTDPNPLSSAPRGALREAKNVVIRRDGTLEPRPGFQLREMQDGQAMSGTPQRMIPWGNYIVYVTDSGTWVVDPYNDAVVTPGALAITGLAYGTLGSGFAARAVETRDSLYLTTTTGLRKITSSTATASEAVGLSGRRNLIYYAFPDGSGLGPCDSGDQAAYRMTVQRRSSNELVVTSSPTARTIGTSTAANDGFNLLLMLDTETVAAGDVLQLWRSTTTATTASDDLFLLVEIVLTASHISTGSLIYNDIIADASLGEALYTNDDQEGIAQANDPAPRIHDLALFRSSVFGADIDGRKSVILTWQYDPVAVTANATKIGLRVASCTTNSNTSLTAISDTTGWTVGSLISGTNIPNGTTITVVGATTATISQAATATGASTVGVSDVIQFDGDTFDIGSSPQALVTGINFGTLFGGSFYSLSGTASTNYRATLLTDIDSGNSTTTRTASVLIEAVDPSYSTALGVNCTKPTMVSPALTAIATAHSVDAAYVDSNDIPNGLIYSKADQPEAFPGSAAGNIIRVGSASHRIDRILATRDALWIFKRDGIFRLTGAGAESGWRVDPFDMTHFLVATDSAVVMDDAIYAWTNRGVVKISDTGIQQISALAIGNLLAPLERSYMNAPINAYASTTINTGWGVANLKDDEYWLSVTVTGEVSERFVYVYNTKTLAWTRWEMLRTVLHGVIDGYGLGCFATQYADTIGPGIDYERFTLPAPSGTFDDKATYQDHYIDGTAVTVTDNGDGDFLVVLPGAIDYYTPAIGDIVYTNAVVGRIVRVDSSTEFIVDLADIAATSAGIGEAYPCEVEFVAKIGGSASNAKSWSGGAVMFGSTRYMSTFDVAFTSSVSTTEASVSVDLAAWPGGNEDLAWSSRFWVPRAHTRSSVLFPRIEWNQAVAHPIIYGITLANAEQAPRARR